MKLIYFHQHFSTPYGSTGIRSYEMAKKLVNSGHQVTMVCGSYSGGNTGITKRFKKGVRKGSIDGIDVIEFELSYSNSDGFFKRSRTFIKFALKSIKLALTEKYDIIFATSTPLTAAIPGIIASIFRQKEFVFEVRDLWPELPKKMGVIKNPIILTLLKLLELFAYRMADRCIGLSPGIVEGIASRGIPLNKIKLISNGSDIELFKNKHNGARPSGVKETDLMAIFAGTHGIANGLDSVLDVAKELQLQQVDDIKFVLIGQGKLKPELIKRAKHMNLNNVIFLPPVDKATLAALFSSADIGLQILANVPAFYYGTSPNKFFDYISASLPVLVNYPGWLADLIQHHNCGFVVPPNSTDIFAEKLIFALELKQRNSLAKFGCNANKLAKQQFDRTLLANEWAEWVTAGKK
ncbi:glycosyltransferase family 4 protein [Flocculibacter collagenilyticus]|uniref:glycosyltransferase family 4 protein n=1 Tax=Flocculibacter collagenilyticus TaxID=2744479 RepID=UPI0018F2DED8|nr:glycosyltransferase family 4 protein [Flocculibacter collagenilyticus]